MREHGSSAQNGTCRTGVAVERGCAAAAHTNAKHGRHSSGLYPSHKSSPGWRGQLTRPRASGAFAITPIRGALSASRTSTHDCSICQMRAANRLFRACNTPTQPMRRARACAPATENTASVSEHRNEAAHSEKRAARQRSPDASAGRRDKAAQRAASAPGMRAQHSGSGSREPRITPSMAITWRQQRRSAPQHGTGAGHAQAAGSRVGRAAQPGARLQARAPPAPALHLVERRPKCAEACHDATRAAAGCAARFGDPSQRRASGRRRDVLHCSAAAASCVIIAAPRRARSSAEQSASTARRWRRGA